VNAEQARARLTAELMAAGSLGDEWRLAFEQVPRHMFIPDTVYRLDRERSGNDLVPLRRAHRPNEWLELVYTDAPIDTQVDDGHPDTARASAGKSPRHRRNRLWSPRC
jgi:protein-L-isoaspartate O-methyltransferase